MLYSSPSISSDTAARLVESAIAEAAEQGLGVAVAVVDAQGALLAMRRMDGVSANVADFAIDKAYTSATMRRTTEAFAERMGSSPSLSLGLSTRPRLLSWGGGLPVFLDGACVGGIGVSGAKDHEDIACGTAALSRLGFSTAF